MRFYFVLILITLLSGCGPFVTVQVPSAAVGGTCTYTVTINAEKSVPFTATTTASPSGNTVPVSTVP